MPCTFADGDVVHLRASGNAPELRCYAEAAGVDQARALCMGGRRPLPLGCIQNRRSLVYVGNLVSAIDFCLSNPDAAGHTFMVSDGEDVSTPELVRRIATALGRRPWLLPVPVAWMCLAGALLGKQAAINRLLGSLAVDITPLQALGWQAPCTMQAGLAVTAHWYRTAKAGL